MIYTRVSSDEQVHGYSLESQEKACRDYCNRTGLTVLRVFREEGESAKSLERTQLNLMQDFVLKNMGKVGYVVVWKVDRFSRVIYHHHMLKNFFMQCGTDLKSATEIIENTPQGRFTENILSAHAQFDNDVRAERTVTGMKTKVLNGYWSWGAPWGYRNTTDSLGKRIIEPDPQKAPVVKYLFEEYSRGTVTFGDLAKKINRDGNWKSKHGLRMSK